MNDTTETQKPKTAALAVVKTTLETTLEPLPMVAVDYNDPKVIEAIKAEICPPGTTPTEFRIFIDKCRQSGLNPLLGECFCVPRWSNVKTGPNDYQLVKKNQFQAAEAGMASRAEKFEGYRGIRFGMIHEMDTCEINTGTGEVKHSYQLTGDRGAPIAAWAQVIRDGFFFSPDVVYLKDFEQRIRGKGDKAGQLTEMWQKPEIMLPKCARAAAFRRAFPTPFSAVYAREELRDDDDVRGDLEPGAQVIDMRPTTDKLAERARAAKEAPRLETGAAKATVELVAEKPKEPAKTPPKTASQSDERREEVLKDVVGDVPAVTDPVKQALGVEKPKDEGPLMVFGAHKGKPISSLDVPTLLEQIALGESKIGNLKTDDKSTAEQKAAKVRACIQAIEAEREKRDAALLADAPPPREPGDDLDVD